MIAHHQKIRALLTGSDGYTVKEMMASLGVDRRVLTRSLKSMPDVYVDRWHGPIRGQYAAVWCVAAVPKNCPKP
tara:strand:+ start:1286 stop:1507 length:222 start_codon:yes stop_codon:yes gene_type:complete